MSAPPVETQDGYECPVCGRGAWDNREKKASGAFNPKSPDFACKDKEGCDWAYWIESKKKKAGGQKRSGTGKVGGGGSGPRLAVALYRSYKAAELFKDNVDVPVESSVDDIAVELFRAHVASGRPIADLEEKKEPAPPPPPPSDEEDLPF